MPKSESQNSMRKNRSIKNVYIHKINSLMKVMGDSQSSLPFLNKARKTICSESKQELLMQRKENNKDAARKARLRKKLYIQLLEQAISNLQELNKLGKQLEKKSDEAIQQLKKPSFIKQQDQIGQYLIQEENEKIKKDFSQVTLNCEKSSTLNNIVCQIENLSMPVSWCPSKLSGIQQNHEKFLINSRMQNIYEEMPEIYQNLKSICSEHSSLAFYSLTPKTPCYIDPYFQKTLMEEYYSKTLCKKNITNVQTYETLNLFLKMDKYILRSQQINQSNFLQPQ